MLFVGRFSPCGGKRGKKIGILTILAGKFTPSFQKPRRNERETDREREGGGREDLPLFQESQGEIPSSIPGITRLCLNLQPWEGSTGEALISPAWVMCPSPAFGTVGVSIKSKPHGLGRRDGWFSRGKPRGC